MTAGNTIPAVEAIGLTKIYGSGNTEVVGMKDVTLRLARGEVVALLGPSGAGKSTFLTALGLINPPTAGRIIIGGETVMDGPRALVDVRAFRRQHLGFVFQKANLIPFLTAAENVAVALEINDTPPRAARKRALELLDYLGVADRAKHLPDALSGGQQQRVAIARALVFEPELLLLDEPLAALDRKLREEMQLEFRRIQKELHVTTINVTHDQREALVVSDEIIVMEGGVIQQHAPPLAIYRQPANAFVAGFVGVSTFLDGVASPAGMRVGGTDCAGRQALPLAEGTPVRGALRAEQIRLGPAGDMLAGCDTVLPGRIADMIFEGERLLYIIDSDALPGAEIRIYHHDPTGFDLFEAGAAIRFGWQAQDLKIFKTGRKEPTGGVLQ